MENKCKNCKINCPVKNWKELDNPWDDEADCNLWDEKWLRGYNDCLKEIKLSCEEVDKHREREYAIKEIGRLGLGFKTYTYKEGTLDDGLEIYLWDEDFKYRYTLASFEKNEKENVWEFREVGDRLTDEDIDWNDLRTLIKLGHSILDVC